MATLYCNTALPFAFALLALSLFVGSFISRILYNLYRHPLAHCPGPRLAAATYLYQTWFCFVGGSRYYIQIAKLHEKYGPVVRITPDEVLLSDPDNYEIINCVGTKYAKSSQFYDGFGIGYSTFSTGPNDLHRIRRGALEPFFSRRNVLELETVVRQKTEALSALVTKKFAQGKPVDLHHAFRSVSVDVITDFAFGQSYDLLLKEDLGAKFFAMVRGIGPTMWVFQLSPSLQKFAMTMPQAIAKMMSKPLAQVFNLQDHCLEQVLAVKADMDAGREIEKPTIFKTLLTSNEKNYTVPTPDQIKDEAYSILAAAADTTGNAMTVAAYHVVNNPKIYRRLREELIAAFPDPNTTIDYLTLEKLPYLTGVIKEGLRLSFGVPGRLARIVPKGGATFNDYFIPGGSFVSMSSWVLHQDPKYFPNPKEFRPERWSDPVEARRIEKAFVPFGKGTRGCVGINLAYCELYLSLGTLFRRFGNLESNVLLPKDLVYDDYFSSYHPEDATKFHVKKSKSAIF